MEASAAVVRDVERERGSAIVAGRRRPFPAAGPLNPAAVLALQRTAGNRAVAGLLRRSNGRALARCAGKCRCGGRCGDDQQFDEKRRPAVQRAARRALLSRIATDDDSSMLDDQSGDLLEQGSTGGEVAELQGDLNTLGMVPELDVDGIFGAHTLAAVEYFQSAHRLAVDGLVGPETRTLLGVELDDHGGADDVAARAGGPCHTPDSPGPDDIDKPTSTDSADPDTADQDVAPTGQMFSALTLGAGPAPAKGPADFSVELIRDPLTDQLAHLKAKDHASVCTLDGLVKALRKRRNIETLFIIAHGLPVFGSSPPEMQLMFQCGDDQNGQLLNLRDIAAAIDGAAKVKKIRFLACQVGIDGGGMSRIRAALCAEEAIGGTCHHTETNVGNPVVTHGRKTIVPRTEADLKGVDRKAWAAMLRQQLLTRKDGPNMVTHENCVDGLARDSAGNGSLALTSDDDLIKLALNSEGTLIEEYTGENDVCWGDLKFDPKEKCSLKAVRSTGSNPCL